MEISVGILPFRHFAIRNGEKATEAARNICVWRGQRTL